MKKEWIKSQLTKNWKAKQFSNHELNNNSFFMPIKRKALKINRLNNLLFVLFLKDFKIYLLSILVPTIISFLLYWIWSTMLVNVIFTPQMFSFISIGCLIVPLYISLVVGEWKSTNFLKQFKGFNIGELSLMLSLSLISIFFSLISVISAGALAYIITKYVYAFPVTSAVFEDINLYIIIFYIFSVILLTISCLYLFIFISNLCKGKYLNIVLNIVSFLLVILFSDILLIPYSTSGIKAFWILQYFNPIKYCVWVGFLITSYQFLDPYGIRLIMSTNDTSSLNISFTNIFIPLLISIIFIVFYLFVIKKKFVWSIKA